MADDKGSSQHADDVKPKKRGCAAHCKRFWWIYLLVSILVILLVVLLIIFVAIPKIAQKKLDEAELTVDSILISQTHPDSYQMSVNSTIRTDGKTHATVDAFTGSMYLEDSPDKTPFTSIDFPETTSDKESIVNVSQHIDISNMGGFTTFNTWLMNNESLRLTIVGDTHVRVKGISRKYGVTFRKTVTLKGLNGFKGLNVTQASVNVSASTNNFKGFADIPNPSVLTIEIGNAQFYNYLNGQDIGTVYMDDLVLRPGINNVSIHADIKQGPVLLAVGARPNCETGVVKFEMGGKNVTDNDGGEITYFSKALASANQTVEINVGQALAAAGLPVKCPAQ